MFSSRSWLRSASLLSVLGVLALAGASCHDGTSTAPRTSGQLTIRLTDAPTDEVSEVNVFITGLTIKPAAGPVVRVASEIGAIDLLALRASTRDLAVVGAEPGPYEFVMVELDQERSSVVERDTGAVRPLQIASEEIKVLGGFIVPELGEEVITLDFDAAASLRKRGNGDWLLTPVIVMVDAGE